MPRLTERGDEADPDRFSVAPFREDLAPSHRGEILFEHARSLLQEEFDRPSIATAQAYVLLSTYKLAYGGSRQAFLYLGALSFHVSP